MKGVDLRTVGELLGHRTFQMTMRYPFGSRSQTERSRAARQTGWLVGPLIAELGG